MNQSSRVALLKAVTLYGNKENTVNAVKWIGILEGIKTAEEAEARLIELSLGEYKLTGRDLPEMVAMYVRHKMPQRVKAHLSETDLKKDLTEYNRRMNDKGLNRTMALSRVGGRYEVNVFTLDNYGVPRMSPLIKGDTCQDMSNNAKAEMNNIINSIKPSPLSRIQAVTLLEENGICFNKPFDPEDAPRLRLFAKLSNYRSSKKGVTLEQMFFNHLSKLN